MTNEEKTKRCQALVEECLKAKRFEEAIALYRQLINLNPADDSYRLGLAWTYHDCGNADQAVACFEHVFEKELQRRIFTGFAFDELVRIFKENKKYDRLVEICALRRPSPGTSPCWPSSATLTSRRDGPETPCAFLNASR